MPTPFADRIDAYTERVTAVIEAALPAAERTPRSLHEAMRYAVLNGGKRVRPLLVYAAGEALDVAVDALDAPAAAIELIHAFSLVHDDLPAMDDDDLRRGKPTVHRKFDEATAILAGDALLPLAFSLLGRSTALDDRQKVQLLNLVSTASGSVGMTGGQAIDLASEGRRLPADELEEMHRLKTGALIHACVMSACCIGDFQPGTEEERSMDVFGSSIGLAFQIRDDLLDVEGDTHTIGKTAGADERRNKATWPALFGVEESRRCCDDLLARAQDALATFGERGDSLRWLANYIVKRAR